MYLTRLYPAPKQFTEDESVRFAFGAEVTAVIGGLTSAGIERVKALWRRFSCDACELKVFPDPAGGYHLTVGGVECRPEAGDRYALRVTDRGVCVRAADEGGLLDGVKTLVQLICPVTLDEGGESFYMSAAEIHDSPAIPFRSIHFCVFPDTRLYSIEKAIHLAGFLKMTHIVLEFWGTLKYECRKEIAWKNRSHSKDELRPLIDLAHSYGMEVIPMLNHLGHAPQSRGCYGRHVALNANLRLSRLFEPDGWTWCVSNPDTLKLLGDMRAELIDLCGKGSYFHLGCDEAYSFASCDVCRRRTPHELLADYLNALTEELCAAGRRPIIWHDQLIRRSDFGEGSIVANGDNHDTASALDLLDRRIVIADWQYYYHDGFNPTTEVFMQKGFDTVLCPWDDPANIASLAMNAKTLGAYGLMLTTWDHLPVFLSKAALWAEDAWSGAAVKRPPVTQSITESACLLRRLYDAEGDFERSGWNNNEVAQ